MGYKYLPTDCLYCKESGFPPEGMTAQCEYCGSIYCFGHMKPDSHKCTYRMKQLNNDLSPTMQKALEYIKAHGGNIERYQGGFWAKPQWTFHEQPWFGANTIEALVKRGYLKYSQWKDTPARREPFPIAAKQS